MSLNLYGQSYKKTYSKDIIINSEVESNSNSIEIISPSSMTASVTFTLPGDDGSADQVLSTDGNGSLTWTTASTGGSTAAGSDSQIQYNNSNSFGASANFIWDDSNNRLGIGTSSPSYTLDVLGPIRVGGNGQTGRFIFYDGVSGNELSFEANSSMTVSQTYTLPPYDGQNGDVLVTDGNGNLTWDKVNGTGTANCTGQGTGGGTDNSAESTYGFVGGGTSNSISSEGDYAFIGGGIDNSTSGESSVILGGKENIITGDGNFSVIGGGEDNYISSSYSGIVAGESNTIDVNGYNSFIGAGRENYIDGPWSGIVAGQRNRIDTPAIRSIIGAGQDNNISDATDSGILAGTDNTIESGAIRSAIGAGRNNVISGDDSFIGAGNGNYITSNYSGIMSGQSNTVSGDYSGVFGGDNNYVEGTYSFAAGYNSSATMDHSYAMGRRAKANEEGAFVFADGNNNDLNSEGTNTLTARFTGGYYFYTNTAQNQGQELTAGNNWQAVSDSNQKEMILFPKPKNILSGLRELEVSSWSYKGYGDQGIRNYGPMAQDFYRLFGSDQYGHFATEKTISTHDVASIGLLGVQGLLIELEENQEEIQNLRAQNQELNKKVDHLLEILERLEGKITKKELKEESSKSLGKNEE